MVSKNMEQSSSVRPRITAPAFFEKLRSFQVFYLLVVLGAFCLPTVEAQKKYVSTPFSRACVCEGEFEQDKDYFPVKVAPDFSQFWNVTYHNTYKIVTDVSAGNTLYLYMCGTTPPQVPAGAQLVEIPVRRVGMDSSTGFHAYELIAQRSAISYYNSNVKYVSSPCLQLQAEAGVTLTSSTHSITTAALDVYFPSAYALSRPSQTITTSGVPYMTWHESSEVSPLARSEWVELLSLFFNREEAAAEIVNHIKTRYECHAVNTRAKPSKPTVLFFNWGYGKLDNEAGDACPFTTTVNVIPSGHAENTYITDAGGIHKHSGTFASLSLANFTAGVSDVDVIIFQGNWDNVPAVCASAVQNALGSSNAWTNNQIYDIYMQGTADSTYYFEGINAEPDAYLLDYISILHPSEAGTHSRYILRRVAGTVETKTILTSSQCVDATANLFATWTSRPCDPNDNDAIFVNGRELLSQNDVCATKVDSPSSAGALGQAVTLAAMAIISAALF